LKALNNLIESYNYSDPKDPVYDPIKDLLDGTIALLIAFGNHIVNVYGDTLRSMRESIGIAPVPGSYPMLSDWRLAGDENSHSKEAAYRFIKWACSNKLSVNNAFLGGIIPQNSVFDCYRLNVEYPWYNAMYEQIPNGIVREVIWTKRGHMVNANEFEDIFASLVNDARKDNLSIDQILPIAEKRFTEYVETIEKQGESR
jgi:multiple sugar transport system substrate-binding protein